MKENQRYTTKVTTEEEMEEENLKTIGENGRKSWSGPQNGGYGDVAL